MSWLKLLDRSAALEVTDASPTISETINALLSQQADPAARLSLPEDDDHAEIAALINQLLDRQAQHYEEQIESERAKRAEAEETARFAVDEPQGRPSENDAFLEELTRDVRSAADGDLSARITLDGKTGPVLEAAESVNSLIESLSNSISAINRSIGDVNSSCDGLSGASEKLYGRSTAQIDSVQSVTFKLSSMAEAADKSANMAENALGVAKETRTVSDDVGEGIRDIENAIKEIEKSTGKISPVVQMIESIAFKTNLLAVNASIEAARAGDAGRGFAVVAQEVRELAGSAKNFADDISEMVRAALKAVERGVAVMENTSTRVSTINTTADRVSTQIHDLHEGSIDQRDKLQALYEAVMLIAKDSSTNAQLAEQTATAAERLAKHGQHLMAEVGSFEGYAILEPEPAEEELEDANGDADDVEFF